MGQAGAEIAARAQAQIGVAFKLHGRKAGLGLDCVGLTAHAMNIDGTLPPPPRSYHLRGKYMDQICTYMDTSGFTALAADHEFARGDILLVQPGPCHQHLLIWVGGGFIHAHAGIRRVVFTPGTPAWPVEQIWRKKETDMATIALAAVGAYFGGQTGAQIGAFIGQQIDAELFKGPPREGPRLKELEVQTSSYGTQIPSIYGAMRVAGTVIWATDLIEKSNKISGGKGQRSTIEYSYAVSMAVALSSKPAARLGRIWADGNLLRGAAGDLKTGGQLRFYRGYGDQGADPLIASIEGENACPAYRGLCYIVFEELQLADFGNRIPSMTFEIFERNGSVSLCDITESVAGPLFDCKAQETVSGYALLGGDLRSALEPLTVNLPVLVRPDGDILEIAAWGTPQEPVSITAAAYENSKKLPRPERQIALEPSAQALAVRYYDPARDYQIGSQQSRLSDIGRAEERIDLPASLTSTAARRIADLQLLYRNRSGTGWNGYILRGQHKVGPGDVIRDEAEGLDWQVTEVDHFGMVSRVTAQRLLAFAEPGQDGDAGRNLSTPDFTISPTFLMLAELPAIRTSDGNAPLLVAAATGSGPGWRRAIVSRIIGGNTEITGSSAPAAAIGVIEGSVPAHPAHLTDYANAIIIQMVNPQTPLSEREAGLADNGALTFWLAGEIIRAGQVDALGEGRYQLKQLQRGCFGTESHISGHPQGESILLLETENLLQIEGDGLYPGTFVEIEAAGLGDTQPVSASAMIAGYAVRPFTPVHGEVTRRQDGSVSLSWIRRSRIDHGWQDGVDHPLDEDSEAYMVTAFAEAEELASFPTVTSRLTIPAIQIGNWGALGIQSINLQISQIGRFAKSAPLTLSLDI